MRKHKNAWHQITALIVAVALVIPMAGVTFAAQSAAAIGMSTDAHHVQVGDSFTVRAAFDEAQESNAATLDFTYNGDLFVFDDYTPPFGISVGKLEPEEGHTRVVLVDLSDYNLQDLGTLTLWTKEDAKLTRGKQKVTLAVEYVLRYEDDDEEEDKIILKSQGEVSFTTLGYSGAPGLPGDTNDDGYVDLIDLSNIIDWFGYDSTMDDWEDWYIYFDFNNNGEIDIFDIAYVARLIGSKGTQDYRDALNKLIAQAEALNEEDYTEESWANLQEVLDAARLVAEDDEAEDAQILEAIINLEAAMRDLDRIGGGDDKDYRDTLDKLIAQAEGLNEEDYTEESWANLQEALEAAKLIAADDEAEDEQILEAIDNLEAAIRDLERVGGGNGNDHRDTLNKLIAEAEALNKEEYTPESWAELQEALDAARLVADDDSASDDKIIEAIENLEEALKNLEPANDGGGTDPGDGGGTDPGDGGGTDPGDGGGTDPGDGGGNSGNGNNNGGGSSGGSSSGGGRSSGGTNRRDSYGTGAGLTTIQETSTPLWGMSTIQWIDRAQATTLLGQAGDGPVRNKSTRMVGIRQDALAALGNTRFIHDTIVNNAVQVRVAISNPAAHQKDLVLSGLVAGETVNNVQTRFQRWYENRLVIVALEQTGKFDAPVEIAAKVSLEGFNTQNLTFYSYNQAANTFERIQNPGYWIDANGYLHFFTTQGGSIIISEGALVKK